jgi:hypothetical protein
MTISYEGCAQRVLITGSRTWANEAVIRSSWWRGTGWA